MPSYAENLLSINEYLTTVVASSAPSTNIAREIHDLLGRVVDAEVVSMGKPQPFDAKKEAEWIDALYGDFTPIDPDMNPDRWWYMPTCPHAAEMRTFCIESSENITLFRQNKFDKNFADMDCFITPDGKKFYFFSRKTRSKLLQSYKGEWSTVNGRLCEAYRDGVLIGRFVDIVSFGFQKITTRLMSADELWLALESAFGIDSPLDETTKGTQQPAPKSVLPENPVPASLPAANNDVLYSDNNVPEEIITAFEKSDHCPSALRYRKNRREEMDLAFNKYCINIVGIPWSIATDMERKQIEETLKENTKT